MPVSVEVVNKKSLDHKKKTPRLLRLTGTVAGMTLFSRIMGFIRDIILAQIFGASPAFDAFLVAQKLPNFMRRLFGEGAFAQAFVPVMSELKMTRPHEEVQEFVNRIAGTLALVVTFVVLLAEISMPWVLIAFAPGFAHGSERYLLSKHMLYITFPYLLLIVLTAFSGSILNTCNKFSLPAFTPVILNVALILAGYFWAPYSSVPIYTIAWAFLLGGVVQLAIQVPALMSQGLLPKLKLGFKHKEVRRVMKLMIPALFGVSVAQVSLLIDNFFASFLPVGSISWLYYSDRLTYLPLGVIGVALATVVLPNLSRHHAVDNQEQYVKTLDWALRLELLVGIPAAVALFVLSAPILATLINRGAFTAYDVLMTTKSLRAFAIGLPAFMLIKILASAFYSRKDIQTPVKIAVISVVFNVIFNLLLIHTYRHAGLALSTALAAIINTLLLTFYLIKKNMFWLSGIWIPYLIRLIMANVALAEVSVWLAGPTTRWLTSSVIWRIEHLILVIIVSLLVYVGMLFALGFRLDQLRAPQAS